MSRSLYLFDLCGTLFRSNTTFDFLDQNFGNEPGYARFRRLSRTKGWRMMNRILNRFAGLDLTRVIALKKLKGFSRGQLEQMVSRFYDEFLVHCRNEEVIRLLRKLQLSGKPVILVSATLDLIAGEVARRMNIPEYHASRLAYRDGICTGRLMQDLLGNKPDGLKDQGIVPPFQLVVTDNLSDLPLLLQSDEKVIVSYPRTQRRWTNLIRQYELNNYQIIFLK